MAKKWHQKATVQAAMAVGVLTIIAAFIGIIPSFWNTTSPTIDHVDEAGDSLPSQNIIVGDNSQILLEKVIVGDNNQILLEKVNKDDIEPADLNDDNVTEIASNILNKEISQEKTMVIREHADKPYFVTLHEIDNDVRNFKYKFQSFKYVNLFWQQSWMTTFDGIPFSVSAQELELHKAQSTQKKGSFYEDISIVYRGCYPHMCPDSWGYFVYYPRTDEGYTVIADKNGVVSFPLGIPKDHDDLEVFEAIFLRNLIKRDFVLSKTQKKFLLSLPTRRRLPNLVNDVPSGFLQKMVQHESFNSASSKVQGVYLADIDADGQLEWLFHIGRKTFLSSIEKSHLYAFDYDGLGDIIDFQGYPYEEEGDLGLGGNFWPILYETDEEELYLVWFYQSYGGSSFFNHCSIYKYTDGEFRHVKNEVMSELFVNEFEPNIGDVNHD